MPLQATSGAASYDAFGGGVPVVPNYIEDVFSTYVYTGTSSVLAINNGIDLAGKGGLVWSKWRSGINPFGHALYDTARGPTKQLQTQTTAAETTESRFTSFNNNGYTLSGDTELDYLGERYCSWTFRKQPKFFDVVTYTGTGSARTVSHALGSTPACIIVKNTTSASSWTIYHQKLNNGTTPQNYFIELDGTGIEDTSSSTWNNTAPTSTVFTVGSSSGVNDSGQTYVAYLFASNAGGFGLAGTDNVITCGNYDGNGSSNGPEVTLDFEPQWLLIRRVTGGGGAAVIVDTMRGSSLSGGNGLYPPYASAENGEGANLSFVYPTATGFKIGSSGSYINSSSSKYIYIAIRRGPMKVPTSGTSVFASDFYNGTPSPPSWYSGFVTDFGIWKDRTGGASNSFSRLTGDKELELNSTGAQSTDATAKFDYMTGFGTASGSQDTTLISWNFRRAPSYMDVVCYTGDGNTPQTVNHNLGVIPELAIVKKRSSTGDWGVTTLNRPAKLLNLNSDAAETTDFAIALATYSTATTINVRNDIYTSSGATFVVYLFATCAGVSKVGSYTGNGSSQTINCGFTGGARFVLIKRTDSTGDWMVSDSARGIVSGNDPYLELNNTNAEVTGEDWLDTDSTGFVVNEVSGSNANTSSATYIFLAIA